jgi:thioredoxin 1
MKIMNVIEVQDGNFEAEVEKSDLPVLVDFFATWCGPCKMMAPVLDAFAEEFAGKIKIAKVNVEDAPDLATRFEITGVPTLMIFKDGQKVDTIVGAMPPAALKGRLEKLLQAAPSV